MKQTKQPMKRDSSWLHGLAAGLACFLAVRGLQLAGVPSEAITIGVLILTLIALGFAVRTLAVRR